jgi:Sulfotransferase domain
VTPLHPDRNHRVLALWCHPRSLSTAFGRMMMERGDVTVLHERFLYLYYVVQNPHLVIAQQLERIESQMLASFDEIVEGIEVEAAHAPVFFKDMAVHVWNPKGYHADEALLGRFSNAFLIRDPQIAVLSHLKQNPDMVFEEVGYDAQLALFEKVSRMTGKTPVVIDAGDLEEDPEGIVRLYCDAMEIPFIESALHWEPSVPHLLTEGDPWHLDLFGTTGFEKTVETFDPERTDHPQHREFVERSMPFYEVMREHRIRPSN